MAALKLPLIVAAIAVPVVAAFLVGGPAVGTAAGAFAAATILVVAARQRPRDPIGTAPGGERRRHVLLVAAVSVEAPGAVAAVVREARAGGEGEVDVLVLAPASIGFLDRWASDVEGARRGAQERLVATVAALAKAGLAAEARVGDEDVVQAVEDELQSYPADEVILVTAGDEEGSGTADAAAAELQVRLRPDFRHLALGAG